MAHTHNPTGAAHSATEPVQHTDKKILVGLGGGVMLGGMTGAGLTAAIIETVGANTLLLWSAFTLLAQIGSRA